MSHDGEYDHIPSAVPPPYDRQADFTDWEANHPGENFRGTDLDAEFNAVQTSVNATEQRLSIIQRDDGALANSIVGIEQIKPEISFGISAVTTWATDTAYSVNAGVWHDHNLFRCVIAHTSGVFADDLAAGRWEELVDFDQWVDLAEASAASAAVSETNAAASETNAANSAASAAVSETNAAASETNAANSATAAQNAVASVMWNDVQYFTAADSPVFLADADRGKLLAIDCSAGAVSVTLPSIATLDLTTAWSLGIKKTDSSGNSVTVNRSGTDTIDGGTSKTIGTTDSGAILIADEDASPDDWTSVEFGSTGGNRTHEIFLASNNDFIPGSTFSLTLATAPGNEDNITVVFDGVTQAHDTFSVSGTNLNFDAVIPSGTEKIEVAIGTTLPLGVPANESVGADQIKATDIAAIRTKLDVPSRSGPNIIVNGGMEVAQRPVPTVTAGGGFFYGPVDRMAVLTSLTNTQTVSQVETSDVGASGYACRIRADGSSVVSGIRYRYRIEAKETRKLLRTGGYLSVDVLHDAGVDIGYSFWVLKPGSADDFSSTFTVYQDSSDRMVQSGVPTTLELELADLSADASNGIEIQILATIGVTGGNKNFDLTSLQFRPGTEATPFVPRPYADELAACQRYYWKRAGTAAGDYIGPAMAYNATTVSGMVVYPTPMRSGGSVSIVGTLRFERNGGNSAFDSGDLSNSIVTETSVRLTSTSSGETAGHAGMFRLDTANDYIELDAEL